MMSRSSARPLQRPVVRLPACSHVRPDIDSRSATKPPDKPLAWLHGEIKTPPFSTEARIEAGTLLRRLQRGEALGLAHSKAMPGIGSACHELRVADKDHQWRIICRVDDDAIVIAEVFAKKRRKTPRGVIERCEKRLKAYDKAAREGEKR